MNRFLLIIFIALSVKVKALDLIVENKSEFPVELFLSDKLPVKESYQKFQVKPTTTIEKNAKRVIKDVKEDQIIYVKKMGWGIGDFYKDAKELFKYSPSYKLSKLIKEIGGLKEVKLELNFIDNKNKFEFSDPILSGYERLKQQDEWEIVTIKAPKIPRKLDFDIEPKEEYTKEKASLILNSAKEVESYGKRYINYILNNNQNITSGIKQDLSNYANNLSSLYNDLYTRINGWKSDPKQSRRRTETLVKQIKLYYEDIWKIIDSINKLVKDNNLII